MLSQFLRWWFWYEPPTESDETLVQAINAYRVRNGRAVLEFSKCLTEQATKHATNVQNKKETPHQNFMERLQACGRFMNGGEIIAPWYYSNVEEAIDAWHRSPGHRSQMLGNYETIGGGQYKGTFVAIFRR